MVGGCGPERVCRSQHDVAIFCNQYARQLAGRRGLAGAVHSDDKNDRRSTNSLNGQRPVSGRVEETEQLENAEVSRRGSWLSAQCRPQTLDDLGGDANAGIGGDQ